MTHERPPWISDAQLACVRRVVEALTTLGVPHQATGGLAGNLWGSTWPLHDVDLDVPNAALDVVESHFAAFVVRRGRLVDDEFDLELLELSIEDVAVELSGADDARVCGRDGRWTTLPSTIARAVPRTLVDRTVSCQRLEDLLAYKRLLGRVADLRDLERLRAGAGTHE
jgi:hypothetical protein